MKINPLHAIDFYKTSHRQQYPEGTNLVYSNFTPRTDKRASKCSVYDGNIVFFGLQYFIKSFLIDHFNESFFNKSKEEVVAKYRRRLENALGGVIPTQHIEDLHDLGYLPICIMALPEGTVSPIKVPVLTIHNTLPQFFWLTNYLETAMSCMLWHPTTSATTARQYRLLLDKYADLTGGDKDFVDFQAHDFSFRGMSGIESAAMSGAGHLLFFKGSDTVPAIDLLEDYYDADSDKELIGCSVAASEHSVICMGTQEKELETFRRLITEVHPSGIVSVVSDSWNLWTVLDEYAPALKQEIEARDGKVVFRPDSGNPADIICGKGKSLTEEQILNDTPEFNAENWGCLWLLWKHFGGTVNDKGYKVLNPKVGLIYGDSITLQRAEEILFHMKAMGFCSSNIVFGIGSYTYQHVTRDTYGFAMKATYGEVNNVPRNILKDPITDDGEKKSLTGLLKVMEVNGKIECFDKQEGYIGGLLKTVFHDGKCEEVTLAGIRATAQGDVL